MINTDKYEGHAEGEWTATKVKGSEHPDEYIIESGDGMLMTGLAGLGNDGANAKLMADAPLLLAEVKRWHKVRDYILEKASHPTVKKLHLKDLLNFMDEVMKND